MLLQGVARLAAICLSISYPTIASVPHSIINGFKNLLSLAAATDIDFKEARTVKEFLKIISSTFGTKGLKIYTNKRTTNSQVWQHNMKHCLSVMIRPMSEVSAATLQSLQRLNPLEWVDTAVVARPQQGLSENDPSKFVAAVVSTPVAATPAAATPAKKEEKKEDTESEDDDMGFGLFD
ncbi:unnamed protein product [Timema podura]|uniref:Large ribosomal subunit protein uL10 n=1 Tax=Timema podura TaxID=61482 RepID=A0ABN7PH65_TIMPD|nr:unnamed protein product [Timema podura]